MIEQRGAHVAFHSQFREAEPPSYRPKEFAASASWVTKPEIDAVLSDMRELPLPHWHWPAYPGRFFVRGNAFAFCCPNRSPDEAGGDHPYSFWLGAMDVSDVAFIMPHIGAAWEYASVE